MLHTKKLTALFNKTLLQNFFVSAGGSLFLKISTALMWMYAIRFLSVEECGILSLINSVTLIMPILLNLGLRQAYGVYYYHLEDEEKKLYLNEILSLYLLIATPLTLLIVCTRQPMLATCTGFLLDVSLFIGAVLISYIHFFAELYLQLLRYRCHVKKLTVVQCCAAVITIIATVIGITHYHLGIYAVVQANGLALLSIIAFGLHEYKNDMQKLAFKFSLKRGIQHLKTGFPFIPSIVFTWLLASSSRWFLLKYGTLYQVGLYGLADYANQLFTLVVLQPLSTAYIPSVFQAFAKNKEAIADIDQENRRLMWYCMLLMAILISVGLLIAFQVGPWIIPKRFLPALPYVWYLLLGQLFFMGSYFATCYLQFYKKNYILLGCTISGSCITLLCNRALIPWYGINGAFAASIAGYSSYFFLILLATHIVKKRKQAQQEQSFLRDNPMFKRYIRKLQQFILALYKKQRPAHTLEPIQNLPEIPITIVMTGYNNQAYLHKSVQSALQQMYTNFQVLYIDDCSTDQSATLLKTFTHHEQISITCNTTRQGKLANLYTAIHAIPDEHIIVEFDADDYFTDDLVLARINTLFQTRKCLVAHAAYLNNPPELAQQLKLQTFCQQTPFFIKKRRSYRAWPWMYSGLRCYKAALAKKIKRGDLMMNDRFLPFFHDAALFYPLLEMAAERVGFIPQPLIIRNIDSPLNDFKKVPKEIDHIRQKVLKTTPYERVTP